MSQLLFVAYRRFIFGLVKHVLLPALIGFCCRYVGGSSLNIDHPTWTNLMNFVTRFGYVVAFYHRCSINSATSFCPKYENVGFNISCWLPTLTGVLIFGLSYTPLVFCFPASRPWSCWLIEIFAWVFQARYLCWNLEGEELSVFIPRENAISILVIQDILRSCPPWPLCQRTCSTPVTLLVPVHSTWSESS